MAKLGIFTISIDVELAWGTCDRPLESCDREAIGRERDIIQRLLALFNAYEISATWAIVAHLLMDDLEWKKGMAHPDFPRPVRWGEERDWFFQLGEQSNDPLWYGRDVVNIIASGEPTQEIASHSFCHLLYDEKNTNSIAIEADVTLARKIHADNGLPYEVFIFPRNCVGYLDVLAAAGISAYRGRTIQWYDNIRPKGLWRMFNLFSFILGIPPKPVESTVDEFGMVNIPDSMLLLGRNGIRGMVPRQSIIRMAKAGLDRAVKQGKIFHLWFHPSNFSSQTEEQFKIIETILQYAQYLRTQGKLEVVPMGTIRHRALETNKEII